MKALGNELKIGKRIKELREQKNMTQQQLAEKTGSKQKFISCWETGERIPTIKTISVICKALGVTLQDFFKEMECEAE